MDDVRLVVAVVAWTGHGVWRGHVLTRFTGWLVLRFGRNGMNGALAGLLGGRASRRVCLRAAGGQDVRGACDDVCRGHGGANGAAASCLTVGGLFDGSSSAARAARTAALPRLLLPPCLAGYLTCAFSPFSSSLSAS